MEIEFDPGKNAANFAKHGVSLGFGAAVLADAARVVVGSHRPIDGEDRFKAIGRVEGRSWTAVYVMRGTRVRILS